MAINFGSPSDNGFVNSSVENGEYTKFLTNPVAETLGIWSPSSACCVPYGSNYGFCRRGVGYFNDVINLKDNTIISIGSTSNIPFYGAFKISNLQNSYICILSANIFGVNVSTEEKVSISDIDVYRYGTIGPRGGQAVVTSDSSNTVVYIPRTDSDNASSNCLLKYTISFNGEITSTTQFNVTSETITLTNKHGRLVGSCGVYGDTYVVSYEDGYIQIGDNAYCDYFVGTGQYTESLVTKEENGFDKVYGLTDNPNGEECIFCITANSSITGNVEPDFIIKTNTGSLYWPFCLTENSIYFLANSDEQYISDVTCLSYDGKIKFIEQISVRDDSKYAYASEFSGFGVDFDETKFTAISDAQDDGYDIIYTINTTTNQTT